MRHRRCLLAVVAVLVAPSCGSGEPTTTAPTSGVPPSATGSAPPAVVIDTDMAADDLVALLYVLSDPDVDVRAITVTGAGEVTCPRGEEIARSLLVVTGRESVPVACGPTTPMAGNRAFPESWRDGADAAYGLPLPVLARDDDVDATSVFGRLAAAGERVTLLTLGPLTNLAAALDSGVDLAAFVDRIVVMGGAVDVPGNVQPEGAAAPLPAEWNLWVDPAAADAVLRAGVPVELVALDATNSVPLDQALLDRLAANDTGRVTGLVRRLFEGNPAVQEGGAYLWDPLAAIAAVQPALVPTRPATIRVELGNQPSAGRTVRDPAGTEVALATVPDAGAVLHELIRVLAGLPPGATVQAPTTLAPVGSAVVIFDGTACRYDGPLEVAVGNLRVAIGEGSTAGTAVVLAHLTSGTLEEALAWSQTHQGEGPPTVDRIAVVGPDGLPSPSDIPLVAGTWGVVCITDGTQLVAGATLTAA
jgi:pyrimidine-specific ribonucleoside hydrolase